MMSQSYQDANLNSKPQTHQLEDWIGDCMTKVVVDEQAQCEPEAFYTRASADALSGDPRA